LQWVPERRRIQRISVNVVGGDSERRYRFGGLSSRWFPSSFKCERTVLASSIEDRVQN